MRSLSEWSTFDDEMKTFKGNHTGFKIVRDIDIDERGNLNTDSEDSLMNLFRLFAMYPVSLFFDSPLCLERGQVPIADFKADAAFVIRELIRVLVAPDLLRMKKF